MTNTFLHSTQKIGSLDCPFNKTCFNFTSITLTVQQFTIQHYNISHADQSYQAIQSCRGHQYEEPYQGSSILQLARINELTQTNLTQGSSIFQLAPLKSWLRQEPNLRPQAWCASALTKELASQLEILAWKGGFWSAQEPRALSGVLQHYCTLLRIPPSHTFRLYRCLGTSYACKCQYNTHAWCYPNNPLFRLVHRYRTRLCQRYSRTSFDWPERGMN